jgi:hypothetical protein
MRLNKEQCDEIKSRLENLSLVELIAVPNCGFLCDGKFACGCCDCAKYKGYYEINEIKERFSDEQKKIIDSEFDNIKGWLVDSGCKLPRNLRSMKCLKTVCNEAIQIIGQNNGK